MIKGLFLYSFLILPTKYLLSANVVFASRGEGVDAVPTTGELIIYLRDERRETHPSSHFKSCGQFKSYGQLSSVQSLSRVQLFATP